MSETVMRRHGLESFLASLPKNSGRDTGMSIQIQSDIGHINLRGSSQNPEFLATTARVLGQELPVIANTMTLNGHRVYWLGPNEWHIVTAMDNTPGLVMQLREALHGLHASVSDLSGGQIVMQLSGPHVRDVLAKGCTLDLHPDEFKAGASAQCGLAKASVLIGLVDASPVFQIVVRRSFADYIARWLEHAARDHKVEFRAI